MGLYDAFLIKENHIAGCGGISQAVNAAREQAPGKLVEVEAENLEELQQAITAGADVVMLDNFSAAETTSAIQQAADQCQIEVSGNVTEDLIQTYKEASPNYISSGALTKHCTAIDMSLLIT